MKLPCIFRRPTQQQLPQPAVAPAPTPTSTNIQKQQKQQLEPIRTNIYNKNSDEPVIDPLEFRRLVRKRSSSANSDLTVFRCLKHKNSAADLSAAVDFYRKEKAMQAHALSNPPEFCDVFYVTTRKRCKSSYN
jgi:hypothetical protein